MRPRFFSALFWILLLSASLRAAPPAGAEALVVMVADQHSAYERTAQLVGWIDRLQRENPGLPLAILVDGDVFELGNVVARRSAGAVDFAMLAAFAQRAPTVVNLGNHEPEFFALDDTVARMRATGVAVVGNIGNRVTGQLFAPASVRLKLAQHEVVIVGLTTDALATFRVGVRPSLALSEPVAWAKKQFPELLSAAPVKIVLSHAGLLADRGLLPIVPDGTLFAGAHDHLRFIHRAGRTVYVQSGSWNEFITLAYLRSERGEVTWEVSQQRIATSDPADPRLETLIRETQASHLTPADTAVVGHLSRALTPDEAASFAVHAAREAAGVDAALVGRTTFGAGLPAGEVSQVALDACVRFDSALCTAEVSGTQLRAMLAAANENADTPFAQRQGDFLVAEGPAKIEPERRYRIATTDWIARDPLRYLGTRDLELKEQPNLRLKAIVIRALHPRPATEPAR